MKSATITRIPQDKQTLLANGLVTNGKVIFA